MSRDRLASGRGSALSALLAALLLAACASAPRVPEPGPGATSVWVAVHTYHSGLMVRSADVEPGGLPAVDDFSRARFVKMGWGDRVYYTSETAGIAAGLRALLVPTDSAIHAVAIAGAFEPVFPDSMIFELKLPPAGHRRMIEFVRATHEVDAEGRAVVIGPGRAPASRFYASDRPFHLFETCNTWVAHALVAGGLPMQPSRAITAGGLARQLQVIVEAQSDAQREAHLPLAAPAVQNRAP
jgi:hypothetical protein